MVGTFWALDLQPGARTAVSLESDRTQQAADPPLAPADLSAVSLRQKFDLPPLPDGANDEATRIARETQVYRRAELLRADADTPFATWEQAGATVAANRDILPALLRRPLPHLLFKGTRLSELGAFVAASGPAHVTVVSRTLDADTALTISVRDLVIDFSGAAITVNAHPPLWLIELQKASNVAVTNATISGGVNAILVNDSTNVAVDGNDITGLSQNGIVVTGASSAVDIHANKLSKLGRTGVMLHGSITTALVEDNDIQHLLGYSNWNAGILLTGRRGNVAANPDTFFLPDHYWVIEEPIFERLENPSRNVILGNTIREGHTSGIYNDGGVANLFLENHIEHNAKEGVCFDNGATANVFAKNTVTGNGQRWGQPDDILALDSVLAAGRNEDGSAVAKLPGVSIDNAIYNQIYANDIDHNWGGGIKMVRTSMFNLVGDNTITDNNLGHSASAHFFGIELGAARADWPATDLDFVGSSGNIVFGNAIRGEHYSGIFIAPDSVQNDTINNLIAGVLAFDVERPS